MSAQGGPARQLTRSPEHEAVPVWSRDGKWIYYLSQAEGEIWRIPSAGGIPDLVLKALGAPKEMSADGRWLYVNRGFPRGSVIRLSGDGNEEVLVENVQGMGWWGFGVGASGIYYQAQDRDGGPEIRFYRFSDHSTESVFRLPRRPGPVLDLSPDERYLIFSLDENEQSDLMILKGVH